MTADAGDGKFESNVEVENWSDVLRITRELKKHGGRIKLHAEGPDARTFILSFKTGELSVYQWDTGDVSLRTNDPELNRLGEQVCRELGYQLL